MRNRTITQFNIKSPSAFTNTLGIPDVGVQHTRILSRSGLRPLPSLHVIKIFDLLELAYHILPFK